MRDIRDREHHTGEHFCLLFTTSWLGSHVQSCRQEAQGVWTFVISLVLVPALVIAAHPHTRTCVDTKVPSIFPCSSQCVVALSTATRVSFSLFTRPAFVKMPWENRNVEGSSATEVDKEFTSEDLLPLTLKWTLLTMQHTETNVLSHPLSLFHTLGGHGGWVRGGYRGPRFNPPTLHERQELFRNLCQDVLCQSSHANHLVPWVVDVVTERNKLNGNRISPSQKSAGTFGGKL